MTEQIHNGTNLNVITHDYIMKTTEYTEFVHCFTKTRWTNNVTQTIIPRTFEVNFTGSSDGDRRRFLIHFISSFIESEIVDIENRTELHSRLYNTSSFDSLRDKLV